MNPLAMLAGSRYSHAAGASGTVTVPAGANVTSVTAHSTAGGTLTITPGGANQTGVALTAIPLIANVPFQFPSAVLAMGQLGPGTEFVFTGTDSYLVTYAGYRTGA